jgi:hypothetical protein
MQGIKTVTRIIACFIHSAFFLKAFRIVNAAWMVLGRFVVGHGCV